MLFKRIVSILITLLILFADSGQMIYAHTCHKSNNTSFSLYSPAHCGAVKVKKECCTKKKVVKHSGCALNKTNCCALSSKYVKMSFPTNDLQIKNIKVGEDILVALPMQLPYVNLQNSTSNPEQNGSPPLPAQSGGKHSFTQVFRC